MFGQRFDSTGSPLGTEFQVNTSTTDFQSDAAVAVDGSGNFVVTWQSEGQDESVEGVFGRQLSWLFADGFEIGNTCAWSAQVGSGDGCLP
ncbi:MAG TPA: hypothetical protein VI942_00680 [Thermoanaerobaculia bacterium]|nr:hypothetical protein [Thermoanaerobaculia bacterium]